MVTVRPVVWAEEIPALCRLDTSFLTDRIYRVEVKESGFRLVEEPVELPLAKTPCVVAEEIGALQKLQYVVVAEVKGEVVGLAAAHYSAWNGRVVLWHLYVQPAHRRCGVGRALIRSVSEYARSAGGWCIWLEAQNVNYPALQFYRRVGFTLCGIDTHRYHPEGPGKSEVALFLVKELRAATDDGASAEN